MANDCIPLFDEADQLTVQVTAAVVGKTFARVSAEPASGPALNTLTDGANIKVATCAAAGRALGVAAYDQATVGGKCKLFCQGIVPVTTGTGGLAAGQEVESDAAGKAVAYAAGIKLGVCVIGATVGNDAYIKLNV